MQPAAKQKLIDYSNRKAPPIKFRSYRTFDLVKVRDEAGSPVMISKTIDLGDGNTETCKVPLMRKYQRLQWSEAAAINFIRAHDFDLGRRAAEQGWHMRLIDYVQCRNSMPAANEKLNETVSGLLEEMVLDQQKIDSVQLPPVCYERRKKYSEMLTAPRKSDA